MLNNNIQSGERMLRKTRKVYFLMFTFSTKPDGGKVLAYDQLGREMTKSWETNQVFLELSPSRIERRFFPTPYYYTILYI